MNYIKYAFIGIAIIISSIVIGYIITNERKVADLKLENQQIAISNETNKMSLEVQKDIVKIHTTQVKSEKALQTKINNVRKVYTYINQTTNELNNIINCEFENINNLEIVCQK